MRIVSPCVSSVSGRFVGSYVYMVLCREGKRVHIKIGMSDNPLKRIENLLVGCPLVPSVLATVELPNRQIACRLEAELHCALAKWSSTGEWFRFEEEDKPPFNAAWQAVFRQMSPPSRPLTWTKLRLKPLRDEAKRRHRAYQRSYMKSGRHYKDFKRAARVSQS